MRAEGQREKEQKQTRKEARHDVSPESDDDNARRKPVQRNRWTAHQHYSARLPCRHEVEILADIHEWSALAEVSTTVTIDLEVKKIE